MMRYQNDHGLHEMKSQIRQNGDFYPRNRKIWIVIGLLTGRERSAFFKLTLYIWWIGLILSLFSHIWGDPGEISPPLGRSGYPKGR
jgi:hypothetical protein